MSSKTYQINNGNKSRYINNNNVTKNNNDNKEYNINRMSKDKDMIISQLKAKIFELELHQKDYDMLNERYVQLKNEFSALNDSKYQLECERNAQDEELNNRISELQNENENLQIGFNEKLSNNKNLFSQNNILGKQIELKDSEIFNLTSKLNELESQHNRNEGERINLEKVLNGLSDINNSQNVKISQLIQDNKTLKEICQDQDQCIRMGNHEMEQMNGELDAKNYDIQNLNSQIREQNDNLNNLKNQLNKNNGINMQYQNRIKDYERQIDTLKEESDNLKNNLMEEKSKRDVENQKNNHFEDILNDREQKINQILREIDTIKIMQQNATNENNILQDENSKLRNHIMILTEQNQNLINEIDNIIDEDEKKLNIVDRKDRIESLLMNNRSIIDQSLNNLDEGINREKGLESRTPIRNTYEYYTLFDKLAFKGVGLHVRDLEVNELSDQGLVSGEVDRSHGRAPCGELVGFGLADVLNENAEGLSLKSRVSPVGDLRAQCQQAFHALGGDFPRDLVFHCRGGRSGSRGIDEGIDHVVFRGLHHVKRALEVLLGLTGEADDDIRGEGNAGNCLFDLFDLFEISLHSVFPIHLL